MMGRRKRSAAQMCPKHIHMHLCVGREDLDMRSEQDREGDGILIFLGRNRFLRHFGAASRLFDVSVLVVGQVD
jgi:hypothetical protein